MNRDNDVALLAEIGQAEVSVIARPRVAVLPTGDELVAPHEPLGPGQIRNSNGPMLVAAAERAGADATELEIARDDRADLRYKIEQGLAADDAVGVVVHPDLAAHAGAETLTDGKVLPEREVGGLGDDPVLPPDDARDAQALRDESLVRRYGHDDGALAPGQPLGDVAADDAGE